MKFETKKILLPALLVMLYAVQVIFFIHYNHLHLYTDSISYCSIAEKFAQGHFSDAVNGYWSPLLPLLMAPFIASGIPSPIALYTVISIFSLLIILELFFLIRNKHDRPAFAFLISIAMIPFAIRVFIEPATPDIISGYFIWLFLKNISSEKSIHFFLIGLTGFLCYLAKYYNFIFISVAFLLFFIFSFRKKENRKILAFALITFLLLSSCWIVLLKTKYGHWMISSGTSYNQMQTCSDASNPAYDGKLHEPPDEHAYSFWDDPGLYPSHTCYPWTSVKNHEQYRRILNYNTYVLISLSVSCLPVLLVFLLPLYRWIGKSWVQDDALPRSYYILIFLLLIYAGGYFLFILEKRYLIPVMITSLFLVVNYWSPTFRIFLYGLLFVSMAAYYYPLVSIRHEPALNISSVLPDKPGKARIASDNFSSIMIPASYHADMVYLGSIWNKKDTIVLHTLKDFNADYYIMFEKDNPLINSSFEKITGENFIIVQLK